MINEFTKNIAITFTTKIVTIILSLIVAIIIARFLGPEKQGIYSLTILLPALLLTFTNFGINQATVYYVCKNKYDTKEVFGNNIFYVFFVSIFAISIGMIIVFFLKDWLFPGIERVYLLFALIAIPFQLFLSYINNILLGLGKIKKFNLILFSQPLFFLLMALMTLIFFGASFGILSLVIAEIFSLVLAEVILFSWARKETKGVSFAFNKSYFKDAFLFGGTIYLGNFFSFLLQRTSLILTNVFLNPASAGLYAIATGAAEKLWLFALSVETMLFPKIASENDPNHLKEFTPLICRNLLLIVAIASLFFFFISRWLIILLFSKTYADSVGIFQILLIGVAAVSVSRILANDIAGRGRPIVNVYLNMGIAVLNIILNIILIPLFGAEGAAWATTISYIVLFVCGLAIYGRISNNRLVDVVIAKKSDIAYYKNLLSMILKPKA